MAPASFTRKDLAEFFRLGLLAGVCGVPAVVRWADSIILEEDAPPFVFLELSTCAQEPAGRVVTLLAEFPGVPTPGLAARMLLGCCHALPCSGPLAELLFRLHRLALVEHFPEDLEIELMNLAEDMACARDLIYGSISEAESKFVGFLAGFADDAPRLPTGFA